MCDLRTWWPEQLEREGKPEAAELVRRALTTPPLPKVELPVKKR